MVYTALDSCPYCFRRIDWSYGSAQTEVKHDSNVGAWALTVSVVLLFVMALVLIQINSSPVGNAQAATLTKSTSASSSVPSQVVVSSQACEGGQCSSVTYTDDAAPYGSETTDISTEKDGSSTMETIEEITLPVNLNTSSISTTSTSKSSSYLQQIYPNWGRCTKCSGGRCNSIYQE